MHPPTPSADDRGAPAGEAGFHRVLVGIDETDESLVAATQAGVLRAPGGELVLLAAVERHLAAHAGLLAAHAEDALRAGTSTELTRARELVDADDAVLGSGSLVRLLCSECASRDASLVAVGVRAHRRVGALTFGGHEVEAVHDVECSLLIARPGWGPTHPDRILVGVDGSPESRAAEQLARSLAPRLGCEVVPVVALGEAVDLEVLHSERADALVQPGSLVDALVEASTVRSLIVVGRRREHGHRWRGSLAERVVYRAQCSVLVVRPDAGGTAAADLAAADG